MFRFQLGFLELANILKQDIVGYPLEDEHHGENGDGLQKTTTGLMVWRKADNWTAFTDGYRTWVRGPNGIQQRLNTELFDWERPPKYYPYVYRDYAPAPAIRGSFYFQPFGVILHGTHSTIDRSIFLEFHSTRAYLKAGTRDRYGRRQYLAWHTTIGEDELSIHLSPDTWGYHAREFSPNYIGVEFAKPLVDSPITDKQVRTFCWYFTEVLQHTWPGLPLIFPAHSEVPPGIRDGKVDPYPRGDERNDNLRDRLMAGIAGRFS